MSEGNEGGTLKPDIHIVVDTSQNKTYKLEEGATEIYTVITDQVQNPFCYALVLLTRVNLVTNPFF